MPPAQQEPFAQRDAFAVRPIVTAAERTADTDDAFRPDIVRAAAAGGFLAASELPERYDQPADVRVPAQCEPAVRTAAGAAVYAAPAAATAVVKSVLDSGVLDEHAAIVDVSSWSPHRLRLFSHRIR